MSDKNKPGYCEEHASGDRSENGLIAHLFRTEFRKIVSVLARQFGFAQVSLAEDIASETFLTAAQHWGPNGIPPNPTAWLYQVARNKAINQLRRDNRFKNTVAPNWLAGREDSIPEFDLSPEGIMDSQLRMIFAVCHPALNTEDQVGLTLRILCGFSINEIAAAFLSAPERIYKRLHRAREKLRGAGIQLDWPPPEELDQRLMAVLTTLYLLFNEGYYSNGGDIPLRKELCYEAMQLCTLLLEQKRLQQPPVYALLALMCFHASRFDARFSSNGSLLRLDEQDQLRWNQELIDKGIQLLHTAGTGANLSKFHLEAAIAYWATQPNQQKEKWERLTGLYEQLVAIDSSPIVALNKIYTGYLARRQLNTGPEPAETLSRLEALNLNGNPFYHVLLSELVKDAEPARAQKHLLLAARLAPTPADRQVIEQQLAKLNIP